MLPLGMSLPTGITDFERRAWVVDALADPIGADPITISAVRSTPMFERLSRGLARLAIP